MALLNKHHIQSLVAIGDKNQKGEFACEASGFLIGFIFKDHEDPKQKLYRTFLVTNRHVFDKKKKASLRFNTMEGKTKIFEQDLYISEKETIWLAHPDTEVDLAVMNVNPTVLRENGIDPTFISEEIFAYTNKFSDIGIAVGDDVYAIGFPMGIAGDVQNFPCVKAGLISRIDDEIISSKKAFIIDSSIFPGNSGGPVILRPTSIALSETKAVSQPYLLGVIAGYLPYSEMLYTHQTNPPTIVSSTRENSGLTYCVPVHFVKEIYEFWLEKQKPIAEPQINKTPNDNQEQVK